jgi:hypothetical protein
MGGLPHVMKKGDDRKYHQCPEKTASTLIEMVALMSLSFHERWIHD